MGLSDDPGKTHYYGDDCDPPHADPTASAARAEAISMVDAAMERYNRRLSDPPHVEPDSADRDGERTRTVGDWLWDAGVRESDISDACKEAGLDPSTPLANVVGLQPGQRVVEELGDRLPLPTDAHLLPLLPDGFWVIVASHPDTEPVQPGSEGEG
jgi:hypothetical protein